MGSDATDSGASRRIEAAFVKGRDEPTHLRMDGERVYVVEWIRDVRRAASEDGAPAGWLVATVEAYSQEADETLTVTFEAPPRSDDPSRPDWSAMRPTSEPAAPLDADPKSMHSEAPSTRSPRDTPTPIATMRPMEPPGMPGWRRANCLACGKPVVRARHAHNLIGGTLSGSWLVTWPTGPEHMAMTGPLPKEEVALFGVCHRDCLETACRRLRAEGAPVEGPMARLSWEEIYDFDYNLHLPADEGTCLFCNVTEGLSEEHIWPLWLSKELRLAGRTLLPRQGAKRPTKNIDITVPVCRSCNNDWLSTLENDASVVLRPMLRGCEVTLTPHEQSLLATWATKMAFLIDRISEPVVPRGFPMELAVVRRPLPSVVVFLAAYSGAQAARAYREVLWIEESDGPRAPEPAGIAATFTAHKVAFHVVASFVKGDPQLDYAQTDFAPALLPLWPRASATLRWPPPLRLPDAGIEALASSLSGPQGERGH